MKENRDLRERVQTSEDLLRKVEKSGSMSGSKFSTPKEERKEAETPKEEPPPKEAAENREVQYFASMWAKSQPVERPAEEFDLWGQGSLSKPEDSEGRRPKDPQVRRLQVPFHRRLQVPFHRRLRLPRRLRPPNRQRSRDRQVLRSRPTDSSSLVPSTGAPSTWRLDFYDDSSCCRLLSNSRGVVV